MIPRKKWNGKGEWNNQSGSALIFTLIVLVILSVLGLSLLGVIVNHTKLSSSERSDQSAYYIAEAGAALKYAEIETAIERYYEEEEGSEAEIRELVQAERTYNNFEQAYGKQPEAIVQIEVDSPDDGQTIQYRLVSTGTIGQRSRTVERPFTVNWIPKDSGGVDLPDGTAVYTNTSIDLSGGATIKGGIKTNSDQDGSIRLDGGATVEGNIYVPFGSEDRALDAPKWMLDNLPSLQGQAKGSMEMPEFPAFPEYPQVDDRRLQGGETGYIQEGRLKIRGGGNYSLSLERSAFFKEIKISSNNKLTIDLHGNNLSIVVDHLNIENGHIELKNPGKLTFYVRDKITLGSGSTLNGAGETGIVGVYYKGLDKVRLAGSQVIKGSLFAERANIELTGGGGFTGHIFTGGTSVKVNGGARSAYLIYAPNADFHFTGGGQLKGMVVSDSLTGDGGGRIEYEEFNLDELPFVSGRTLDIEEIITKEPIRETDEQEEEHGNSQ
ncbi:pilus assembly PilX N-terminal domain-containing protein [Sediminibacillus sp. JSM 1682029]|uniref:pilus assembly PilX N-terminal domain-containing protein n=1 Tax=Sediminibacillus sp. JSM 1682029 TaxID=3229857 RepID=UPI0035266A9B